MTSLVQRHSAFLTLVGFLCLTGHATAAPNDDIPANSFDYTRTTAYTYNADGSLATATTEPGRGSTCSVLTYDYDKQGNVSAQTLASCVGVTGRSFVAARTTKSDYAAPPARTIVPDPAVPNVTANVTIAAGIFPNSVSDADPGHPAAAVETDPRFGAVTKTKDMNGLVVSTTLDAFGRPIRQVYADQTSKVTYYCAGPALATGDVSSFTPGCPGYQPAEVQFIAGVAYVHTELRDAGNAKMAGFTRVWTDRLGREVRRVSEGFDGVAQPAAVKGGLIAVDTVYDSFGSRIGEAGPYFLATGSASTSGRNDARQQLTIYDAMGRPKEVDVTDPNANGTQSQQFPDAAINATQVYSKTTYAYLGLTTIVTNNKGQTRKEEHGADGGVLRVTDAAGAQVAMLRDAFGNVVSTQDALRNVTTAQYDYRGNKVSEQDPDKGTTKYCHDAIGQLKALQNSTMRGSGTAGAACPDNQDSGVAATPTARWTTLAYDLLGHMTARIEPEMSSTWSYDKYAGTSVSCGFGRLCDSGTSLGSYHKTVYDALGRLTQWRVDMGAGRPSFGWGQTFAATTGRMDAMTYPSGLQVGYVYTPNGYTASLVAKSAAAVAPLPNAQGVRAAGGNIAPGAALWTAQAVNAQGRVELETYANGISEATGYQAGTGHVVAKAAGLNAGSDALSQTYGWDAVGNVLTRIDNNADGTRRAVSESFGYDAINRLTSYSVNAPAILPGFSRAVSLQYNALGQLLYKSDEGSYSYAASGPGSVHPHALQALVATNGGVTHYVPDLNGNVTNADGGKYTHLSYTSFDRVAAADNVGYSAVPPIRYGWVYDERHARVLETRTAGGNTRSVYYVNPDDVGGLGFETEVDSVPALQSNRHFLSVGGDVVGVLVSTGSLPALGGAASPSPASNIGLNKVEYWHTDHLGSLVATTDHLGNVTARYSYDPFGKRRVPDGNYDAAGNLVVDWSPQLNAGTARGFTRHEELDDIGLVNMNGRLFDATTGLFVQSDDHVPDPMNLQSYGRYSYVMNNPLNATDPSGFDPSAGSGFLDSLGVAWQSAKSLLVPSHKNSSAQETGDKAHGGVGGVRDSDPGTGTVSQREVLQASQSADGIPGQQRPGMVNSANRRADRCAEGSECARLSIIEITQLRAALRSGGADSYDPDMVGLGSHLAMLQLGFGDFSSAADALGVAGISAGQSGDVPGVGTVGRAGVSGSPSGRNCFVAGTLVRTSRGLVPIEQIAVGDQVESRDPASDIVEFKPVVQLFHNPHQRIVKVTLETRLGRRETLGVTPEHPFILVDGSLVAAARLRKADILGSDQGEPLRVVSIVATTQRQDTFNFEVADSHTYFVGHSGAWVHNQCNGIDWSIVSKLGETRPDHVNLHNTDNLGKIDHGVFYGVGKTVADQAYARAMKLGMSIGADGKLFVPMGRIVGRAGGSAGGASGELMYGVKLIFQPGTNKIITAYPANR